MRIFIDHLGREVEVPDFPQRIISLCPSITETLVEMVGPDKVVGRTRFCIHPQEKVQKITRVGGTKEIKFQRLRDLNPDLIIAEKEENTPEMVAELERHYPVFVVDVETVNDGIQMISELGKLTASDGKAEKWITEIQQKRKNLSLYNDAPKVLYLIWQNPMMVVGKHTYIDAMLAEMKATNVGRTFEGRYPVLTQQDLKGIKVDEVWLSSEPYPFGKKHIEAYQQIFPHAHVRLVDGEMFSWYGVRMLEAFPYLEEMITSA